MNAKTILDGISVCIIARNEEKMLEDCLKSVRTISDEIILVDTGSDDKTIEIAEKYGCRVFEEKWENDFSKARNYAIDRANYKYILSIDADERLTNPELVLQVLKSSKPDTGGWLIEIVSSARRKDGSVDTYVSNLIRLFLNKPEIKFYGMIHEQIVEPILQFGFKIEATPLKILHLGYSHSPDEMRKKQIRNLELLNTAILKDSENSYNIFQRAKTFLALGNLAQAEQDIRKCLSNVNKDSAVYPQALNFGAVISYQLGSFDIAIERCNSSLGVIHRQSFANFILGESLTAQEKYEPALDAYFRMDDAQRSPDLNAHIAGDYYLPLEQLCFRIGKCYVGLKDYNNALIFFKKGNEVNSTDISNIVGIANVEYNHKNFAAAKDYILTAMKISPDNLSLSGYLEQIEKSIKAENGNSSVLQPVSNQVQTSDSKTLITLSMIVKNEEVMLEGCLQSVQGVVDEIVIVDTGSTDKTKDIANKYNAKIFSYKWENDFSAARNESLRHSSGEWILYLDADERLSPNSAAQLRKLLSLTPNTIDGFICTIESNHLQLDGSSEFHSGGYPRLFRNYGYPKIKFQGRVHEQITPSLFALGKSIVNSELIIEHLGYNQTRQVMEEKVKRNYTLLIRHVQEDPLNSYAWYQLGQTLAQMSLFKEAEGAIRFSLNLGDLSPSVFASASATLAQLMGNQKKYDEALQWSEKSLEKAPEQVYGMHLKAYSLFYLGKYAEAEQCFLEVLNRMKAKKGVPKSGFDIAIPIDVVMKGLQETRLHI